MCATFACCIHFSLDSVRREACAHSVAAYTSPTLDRFIAVSYHSPYSMSAKFWFPSPTQIERHVRIRLLHTLLRLWTVLLLLHILLRTIRRPNFSLLHPPRSRGMCATSAFCTHFSLDSVRREACAHPLDAAYTSLTPIILSANHVDRQIPLRSLLHPRDTCTTFDFCMHPIPFFFLDVYDSPTSPGASNRAQQNLRRLTENKPILQEHALPHQLGRFRWSRSLPLCPLATKRLVRLCDLGVGCGVDGVRHGIAPVSYQTPFRCPNACSA
jgi:hypothetical protein